MTKKGLVSDAYAKVWGIYPNKNDNNKIDLQVSISNKINGKYAVTFQGFIKVVDKALEKAKTELKENDTIKLTCEPFVTTSYFAQTKKNYTYYWVTDFEIVKKDKEPEKDENGFASIPDGVDEEIPFE